MDIGMGSGSAYWFFFGIMNVGESHSNLDCFLVLLVQPVALLLILAHVCECVVLGMFFNGKIYLQV
mgnify:FL=1